LQRQRHRQVRESPGARPGQPNSPGDQ